MKNTKNTVAIALFVTIAVVGAAGITAHAAAIPANTAGARNHPTFSDGGMMGADKGMRGGFGVHGTVESISGSTLTVTSTDPRTTTTKTYTVDATNAKVMKLGAISSFSGIAVGDTVSVQGKVSGTAVTATMILDGKMMGTPNRGPEIFGTVSAINGNSITLTGKMSGQAGAGATYTIDATNATVTKNGSVSTVSAIVTGDAIAVQGTVNGATITATKINDGVPQGMMEKGDGKNMPNKAPTITGNGQPIVAGAVTAISGNTLTLTNTSNVTYTIDATNAKVMKPGTTSATLATIAVGDRVLVQGAINGNSVLATNVIDQGVPMQNGGSATTPPPTPAHRGFFGNIFSKLFGF